MTRRAIVNAINGSYHQLQEVYNQYKIDNKHDAYFGQVSEAGKDTVHYKSLRNRVIDILRKLDQRGVFEEEDGSRKVEVGRQKVMESVAAAISVKPIVHKATKMRVVIDDNPHINREDLSEEMKALYDENKRIYKDMSGKHAQLDNADLTDMEAKTLLNDVLASEEILRENWKRIDDWYKNNGFTDKAPEKTEELKPAELASKINAAENYIRRYHDSKKPYQMARLHEYRMFLELHGVKIPEPKK